MTNRVMIIGSEDKANQIKQAIKENNLYLKVVDFWEYTPRDNNDKDKQQELLYVLPEVIKDKNVQIVIFASDELVAGYFNNIIPGKIKQYEFIDLEHIKTIYSPKKNVMIIGEKNKAEFIKEIIKQNNLNFEIVNFWECNPSCLSFSEIEDMTNSLPNELKEYQMKVVIFASNEKVAKNFADNLIPNRIEKYDFKDFVYKFDKKAKKVLYIVTNSDLGGISNYLLEIVRRLPYNVIPYFTMNSEGYLSDELEKLGYKDNIFFIPMTNSATDILCHIKSNIKTFFLILKIKPDLIHCNATTGGIVGRICGFLTRTPVIHTIHGCPYTDGIPEKKQKFYRKLEYLMSYLTTKTICVCEYDKQLELGVFPQKFHHKLVTVLNGMSDTDLKKEYNSENSDLNIVMISRFCPQKDPYTLIEAIDELTKQEGLNINLNLYGYGPELEDVKEKVVSCNNYRIKYQGQTTNPAEIIIKNDIYALISNWEGLPLGIIEAMRARMPIIASAVGGNAEAVINDENGYIISSKNKEVLKKKIRNLYQDRNLLKEFGEKSRKLYEEKFTADMMARNTFGIYKEL